MNLTTWAFKWGVPYEALADLRTQLGVDPMPRTEPGKSEGAVQAAVRLEAAQMGVRLWRNNVGALLDTRGVPVRYGLANDTAALNKQVKSGDLIGWRRVIIGPQHVGTVIAQFVSREVKESGWSYSGNAHELAQERWALLVAADGGDACFASGEGTL